MSRNLELERAKSAHGTLNIFLKEQAKSRETLCNESKKLPVRIVTSGLGQSLAFLRAKNKGDGKKQGKLSPLINGLNRWLSRQGGFPEVDALDYITGDKCTSAEYRRATQETLAWLGWLNRLVEGAGAGDQEPNTRQGAAK